MLMALFSCLLPAVAHEHLKERGLFGLPAPGANPSDYYHQMTLMAGHPAPYGDLLPQTGPAAGTPHLHDYLNPVEGECLTSGKEAWPLCGGWGGGCLGRGHSGGCWLREPGASGEVSATAAAHKGRQPWDFAYVLPTTGSRTRTCLSDAHPS